MSGTFDLRATSGALTNVLGRYTTQTVVPPPVVLSVTLSRVAAGSGATVCTGGVALPAGALLPGGTARLEVAGVEVPASVQDTGLRHADGSVSWLRVQTTRTLTNGAPESATLRLRAVQASPVPFSPIAWPTGTSGATWTTLVPLPGLVTQTDAAVLCAAWPTAPLVPRASDGAWATSYNAAFDATWEAAYLGWDGVGLNQSAGQYDRPYTLATQYARTGHAVWLARALSMAARLRDSYWASNAWGIPEWLTAPDWWLLADVWYGDGAWRTAMLTTGIGQTWFPGGNRRNGIVNGTSDPREVGALGVRQLLALWKLGRTATFAGTSPPTVESVLLGVVGDVLASPLWRDNGGRMLQPDLSGSYHFQTAILVQALAEVADAGVADAPLRDALRARVRAVMDWMWATARTPTTSAFFAADNASIDRVDSAPDLEGFWPSIAGYLIRWGIEPATWRVRGDAMLDVIGRTPRTGDPDVGPFLAGQKQWNEAFHRSAHYLGMRG